MSDQSDKKSTDLLGIANVTKAFDRAIEGVGVLLSKVCVPAAEEYGLYLKDRVHNWRATNMVAVVQATERKLKDSGLLESVGAQPRLVNRILEEGSWISDSEVQEMWGGLFASACTEAADDDSNLLFIELLSRLTSVQAKLLRYACTNSAKFKNPTDLIHALPLQLNAEDLIRITCEQDLQRIDREMDNLRALGLIDFQSGFPSQGHQLVAAITVTGLALHMFVRCQGVRMSPIDYFAVTEVRELIFSPAFAAQGIWRPVEVEGNS